MSSTTSPDSGSGARERQVRLAALAGYLLPGVVGGVVMVASGDSLTMALPAVLFQALLAPVGWVVGFAMNTWPGSHIRLALAGVLLLAVGLVWLGFRLKRQPVRCALVALGMALFGTFGLMGFGPA